MNILFRLLLFIVSTCALLFTLRKIRKAQVQIDNAVFWILFMLALVVVSVYPRIIIILSNWIGIESPANFVFLCIIFLLLFKVFHLSLYLAIFSHNRFITPRTLRFSSFMIRLSDFYIRESHFL